MYSEAEWIIGTSNLTGSHTCECWHLWKKDTSTLSPPVSGTVGTLKLRKLNKQGMVISTRHEVIVGRVLSITALSL